MGRAATQWQLDPCLLSTWCRTITRNCQATHLPSPFAAVDGQALYLCYERGATFKKVAGWKLHRIKAHAALVMAKLYAATGQCNACMKDFRTRPRLVATWTITGRSAC